MCVAASANRKRHGSHSLKRRKNTRWNRGRSLSCVRIAIARNELSLSGIWVAPTQHWVAPRRP